MIYMGVFLFDRDNSMQLVYADATPFVDDITGLESDPTTLFGGELRKVLKPDGTARFSVWCLVFRWEKAFTLHGSSLYGLTLNVIRNLSQYQEVQALV